MATPKRSGTITGMDIGEKIALALGLPPETNLIQIRIGLDEPVEVIARYYPSEDAVEKLAAVLAIYHVVLVRECPDDTMLGEPMMDPIRHTKE